VLSDFPRAIAPSAGTRGQNRRDHPAGAHEVTDDRGGFEDRLLAVEETLLLNERKLGIERPRFVAVAMPDVPEDPFDEAQRIMLEEGSVEDSYEEMEGRDTRPEAGTS
jgi:hypothetical protein